MATVLSLYAGPGAGKSTCAAYLFAQLKAKGYNVELVREYIKDWAWENRQLSTYDQFYILGKQIRRESFLLDKVDYIVTDSPVWVCCYYSEALSPPLVRHGVEACAQGYYQQAQVEGHGYKHLWVKRPGNFDPRGRYHNEEEALKVDEEMRLFLRNRGVRLVDVSADFSDLDKVIESL
jgi:hypothetical protein